MSAPLVRRLQHDAVAGDERARRRAAREREREVEGADDAPHPVRTHHVVVVARGPEPRHRGPEPVVLLHLVAVPRISSAVSWTSPSASRAVLADLVGHERREVEQPVLHHVGGVAQDPDLAPPRRSTSSGEGLRGSHGVLDVLRASPARTARSRCPSRSARLLVLPFSTAPRRSRRRGTPAELVRPGRRPRRSCAELLVVGRHRGVGDAERLLCHGSPPVRKERSGPDGARPPSQVRGRANWFADREIPGRAGASSASLEARDLRPEGAPATGSAPRGEGRGPACSSATPPSRDDGAPGQATGAPCSMPPRAALERDEADARRRSTAPARRAAPRRCDPRRRGVGLFGLRGDDPARGRRAARVPPKIAAAFLGRRCPGSRGGPPPSSATRSSPTGSRERERRSDLHAGGRPTLDRPLRGHDRRDRPQTTFVTVRVDGEEWVKGNLNGTAPRAAPRRRAGVGPRAARARRDVRVRAVRDPCWSSGSGRAPRSSSRPRGSACPTARR